MTGTEASTWKREAWRLRFRDPDLEARFRGERIVGGTARARIMLTVAILATAVLGLVQMETTVRAHPGYVAISLAIRFGVMIPIWLIMWLSPGWPGHERRAHWLYPLGTTVVVWAVAALAWYLTWFVPSFDDAATVLLDTLAIMLVSVFSLPLFFGGTLLMLAAGAAGPSLVFVLTVWADKPEAAANLSSGLIVLSLIALALAWHREVGDRREFAQREEVAALNRELARLNAEKNEFMAAAAHDLRVPLGTVRGLLEQVRLGRIPDAERREQAMGAMDDQLGRMLGLVANYLGAHALETGSLPLHLEPLDLRAMIRDAAQRHSPAAHHKAQMVIADPGPPAWARGDAVLLGQVLDNFLSNALKFSPRDGAVRLGVAALADEAGAWMRIDVTDSGPGIPLAEQAKLFRKFSRTSVRPSGSESSHGLGLAVAKRVAEAMGGRVGCESEGGGGATFWVALPSS